MDRLAQLEDNHASQIKLLEAKGKLKDQVIYLRRSKSKN